MPRWEQDLIEQELWENLNNLIYQKMREESLPSVNHMLGYDHAGRFWQILQAYACGDLVSVPRMLPEEIGVAKGHYPCFRVAINLIISEIYCDNAIKTEALAAADKFLTGNFSQWEKGRNYVSGRYQPQKTGYSRRCFGVGMQRLEPPINNIVG